MENKNTIIAVILMAAVWIVFTVLNPPQAPVPQSVDSSSESVATPQEKPEAKTLQSISPSEVVAKEQLLINKPGKIEEISVENEMFTAKFSTSGARITFLTLKNFRETSDPSSQPINIVEERQPKAGSIRLEGEGDLDIYSDSLYTAVSQPHGIIAGNEKGELVFSLRTENGLLVEKIYKFQGDSYAIDLEIKVHNLASRTVRGALALSLVQPWDEKDGGSYYEHVGPSTLVDDGIESDSVKDITKETKVYKNPAWSVFEKKYFMAGIAPGTDSAEKVEIKKQGELVLNSFISPYAELSPNQANNLQYILYFGPRDLDILEVVGHRLDEAIDFGWFTVIAVPLREVLNFFYGFVKNYGVAIILLTIIIKMLFWPLTHKSYASMKEMQKIQPEIQKLRDKYKNNKEKMNQEVMALYKEKRVNPFGGCLPMIIQIPVFFALYKVLMIDFALRQAPFALWINDLSVADTLFTDLLGLPFTLGPLPLVMGFTMFLQQKMTPSTMDPQQAKIFMMMPVIFTFMFLNFPAGLVLYWLVNNLLTILQQYFIHRKFK